MQQQRVRSRLRDALFMAERGFAERGSALLYHRRRLVLLVVRYGLFVALACWLIAMSVASEHFLSLENFLNVARQAAPLVIIGVGMTFVMATAGIDLSVGSVVALVSVLIVTLLELGLPTYVVIASALLVGLVAGLLNGVFVRLGLPAFIVTLAALTALRGVAFVISDGYATPVRDDVVLWLGRGQVGALHVPILVAVIVGLIGWVLLNSTKFGIHALAVGGHEDAARAMGINVGRVKVVAYGGSGLLAALAGVILTGRLGNGSPNAGIMLELEVIAATVLGGTSLFGGWATIGGTVAGALFINFVRNGLNLLGVNPFWVQVVTGIILLIAVLVNTIVNRRVKEWALAAPASSPNSGRPAP
jgi:inositol transport system permease protein